MKFIERAYGPYPKSFSHLNPIYCFFVLHVFQGNGIEFSHFRRKPFGVIYARMSVTYPSNFAVGRRPFYGGCIRDLCSVKCRNDYRIAFLTFSEIRVQSKPSTLFSISMGVVDDPGFEFLLDEIN